MASAAHSPAEIARFRSVLGVSPNATLEELTKAFRTCAKMHHPDMGGNNAHMADINNAYDFLRGSAAAQTPPLLPPAVQPTASELAEARETKLAAERAAAKQLADDEAIWGPGYQLHGTKGKEMPMSTTSGIFYEPLPEYQPPAKRLGRKRTREEQSLGAPIGFINKRTKIIMQSPAAVKQTEMTNSEKMVDSPAIEEQATTTKPEEADESVSEEVDLVDNIFAAVKWEHPLSAQDLTKQVPDFVAWLEDESAWNWHTCYSEKDGFKLMGSERNDGQVFLWKFCCETEAISMAVKTQ